jgi:hypothetical protein
MNQEVGTLNCSGAQDFWLRAWLVGNDYSSLWPRRLSALWQTLGKNQRLHGTHTPDRLGRIGVGTTVDGAFEKS